MSSGLPGPNFAKSEIWPLRDNRRPWSYRDVVVTNPTHIAVAIKYDPEKKDAIPLVIAKGQRLVAEQIKQIADEHDIPIIENPPVARMLFKLVEIGHYVPRESFKVVAEILAFVFHLKNKKTKATNTFDR